jgi:integrase
MKRVSSTSSEFNYVFSITPDGIPQTLPADNIPILHWPDGTWCYEANIYMFNKFEQGLSRLGRGSTLHTYATQLCHIIRYCFSNKIDFIKLTDTHFRAFITYLKGERSETSDQVRSADSVLAIGKRTLDFLSQVALMHDHHSMLGPDGQIRAIRKKAIIKIEDRTDPIARYYWHHKSFPRPSGPRQRNAISQEVIDALITAATNAQTSLFIRRRRYTLIRLLEITGGRREEVRNLTVESVREAYKMENPSLRLITVKRRGNIVTERLIPISKQDCEFLLDFIEKSRQIIINKTLGRKNDHGLVIISERTGKPFATNTITQELHTLKSLAKIPSKAHPHMFRHRFITKLFVSYIQHYCIVHKDDFRRRLLDTDYLKRKVMELTGHKRISSLDRYIDPAFDEYFEIQKASELLISKQGDAVGANLLHKLISGVQTDQPKHQILSDLRLLEAVIKK